jgi:serine/threonine protein kinase
MIPRAIAHYRITAKLGEGGMGELYRATDTKLGRDVAIKILPEVFAQDPDRMARFTREAQVLASLNHPNIAAIYGVEERALVMELVEGPTLAERIAQGPIPLEEALPIARQMNEALEYAHERGVIHRDLKPANIKVTPEGRVKVLDFGLAKAVQVAQASACEVSDPASSPTLTMRARWQESLWAPLRTCRRSRRAGTPLTGEPTSGPSAWCCTKCSPAARCSAAEIFLRLIRSAITMGRAFLTAPNGAAPEGERAWGCLRSWRSGRFRQLPPRSPVGQAGSHWLKRDVGRRSGPLIRVRCRGVSTPTSSHALARRHAAPRRRQIAF